MRRIALLAALALPVTVTAQPTPSETLLAGAREALERGDVKAALSLTEKAVQADPKNPQCYRARGVVLAAAGRPTDAAADFTRLLELDPNAIDAYDRRGAERFKLGDFAGSLNDFDKYLEARPQDGPGHWRRGISCYYARAFQEGVKQFNAYEKVDTNDVENAVWHYLCNVPLVGVEKARAAILKIGKDKRVPMTEVYELFAGRAKAEDVLKAARAGDPPAAQLKSRLFYAHLYLGLYHESLGDTKEALRHLEAAAENRIAHYMGDVARVHRDLLRKSAK